MRLLTFLKTQNPRRVWQGFAGGWLEARRRWSRCQVKDPPNPTPVSRFPQAHLLSIGRAVCTTLVLAAIAFGVCSPAGAQFNGCGPGLCSPGGVYAYGYGFQGGCGGYNSACASAPSTPVLTYVGSFLSFSDSGSVSTCTGVPIGTAAGFTTRRIIISIIAATFDGGIASVTIGGVSATIHVQNGAQTGTAIVSADVPTGTAATVVITEGGTIFLQPVLGVYTVDDALLISTTRQQHRGQRPLERPSLQARLLRLPAGSPSCRSN